MTADAAGAAALLEQLDVASPTTIETLPDELHPLILQFLESRSMVDAAGVCRSWRRHVERVAEQKLRALKIFRVLTDATPPSWLRADYDLTTVCAKFFTLDLRHEFWREPKKSPLYKEWRLLRIEQVMRMTHSDPERHRELRDQILEHMTPDAFVNGRMSMVEEMRRMEPQAFWMMEHGWKKEPAAIVCLTSYGGSYAVAAAFRGAPAIGAFALSSTRRYEPGQLKLQNLLCETCLNIWKAFSEYAWSAEEQDEPDIPEVGRIYPAADSFAALTGEFSLSDEDPSWLALNGAPALGCSPGLVFDSRCISVCMAANDLNFPDGAGFRTPVRVDGVVEYRLRDSPVVRFVSAPRDRSGCHSLIPVDHDTFRLPPLARITLEQVDEPGEWDANGHVIWQRCYTVSLSYG